MVSIQHGDKNVHTNDLYRFVSRTFEQELDEGPGIAAAATAGDQIVEVVPSPSFDLETYVSSYAGRARTTRLKFIALRVPSLQNDAFRSEFED